MKTRSILFFLLIPSLFTSLFAQSNISGNIKDDQQEAIYFATVALYHQADSTIANAVSTDEKGFFKMDNIKDGDYYLEATMLSYENYKIENLSFPTDHNRQVDINLAISASQLATVEVTAKVPLLEQQADRLIVNVENNLTSLNGSLLDVMKKVPGMLVVGDKLSMAGQQNITILINGKTTQYMDVQSLLKDMPGDNIKKVEVIHQPGAEFEASGTGPIINIILKKNSLFGTNGSASVGVAKGENWRNTASVNLSHYQGKLNINGGVGYRKGAYFEELKITRNVNGDIYEQQTLDPELGHSLRANLSLDWDMTDRHRLGVQSRIMDWRSDYAIKNITNIDYLAADANDLRLLSTNKVDNHWQMLTLNPYYTFAIDTTGQQLDFDVNIANITADGLTVLSSEELNHGVFFPTQENHQPGETQIFAAKLDYIYPFSKDLKFKMGAKYSTANLDNDVSNFVEQENGSFEKNLLQSNHFIFDETIAAAYAKLKWMKGKWSGTLGLRYENSQSKGHSVTLDSTLTRDIAKLFPSFSLSREITSELGATFAYSYRIDRPRYSSLNPFVYYLDPFTFQKGNPNLSPSLTHSMKFNLTYDKQPFFNIEYKINKDAMVEVSEQNDVTGTTNLVTVNLESFKVFNASLFFPLDFIPKISGYGGIIANYGKYDAEYLNQAFLRSRWDFTGFLQTNFKLPGDINAEVTGWYNSGGQQGIIVADWMYGVDVGMSKKFWNDKATINVGVENLLARYMHGEIKYANMDASIYSRWDGPVVSAKFTYKFGNQHIKSKKGRRSGAAEELNRAQQN